MRSKRFRTFLGCLFFFGLLVAALPILSFMTSPSIMDIRRERAAMATWPSVPGLLDEVRFQREWNRLRGRTWFYVEVSYRYTVNGQEYAGSGLGIQRMRDTSKEELANRMNRFVAVKNIMSREEGVKGYREPGSDQAEPRTVWRLRDQPATVYYDPQKTVDFPAGYVRLRSAGPHRGIGSCPGLLHPRPDRDGPIDADVAG